MMPSAAAKCRCIMFGDGSLPRTYAYNKVEKCFEQEKKRGFLKKTIINPEKMDEDERLWSKVQIMADYRRL